MARQEISIYLNEMGLNETMFSLSMQYNILKKEAAMKIEA